MASKQMLVLVAAALAVAFLPAPLAAATEHWVGDDKGWTLGFNYSAWAQTKQFKVGDTLGTHATTLASCSSRRTPAKISSRTR